MIHARDTDRIQKLDTTTYNNLVGTRLVIATSIVCLGAFVNEVLDGGQGSRDMAKFILTSWLYFLAALRGIGLGAYGVQRFSSKEWNESRPAPQVTMEHPAVLPEGVAEAAEKSRRKRKKAA